MFLHARFLFTRTNSRIVFFKAAMTTFDFPVPRSILVKSDSREDILHEDAGLAATFIKTLFCVLYEVYSSSVSSCHSYSNCFFIS